MTPKTFAEQKILHELPTGEFIDLRREDEDDVPPLDAGPDRRVRASFLRWLVTGAEGAPPLHAKGLRIEGALIEGDGTGAETPGLDLEGCTLPADLGLVSCRVPDPILLRSARLRNLFLNRSHLADIEGDRLQAEGNVSLAGAGVEGTVRLPGACLGGLLDCDGGNFHQPDRSALLADGLKAEHVYLRKSVFEGTVYLIGARLNGNLECDSATFRRNSGKALVASNSEVAGAFFWRGEISVDGLIDLRAASFRAISDHRGCWPKAGNLYLDKCSYGAFVGGGVPVSAEARIEWLGRQYAKGEGREFRPQPWEQCAKVLREMGHADDACAILIDKERRLRADRRKPARMRWAVRRRWTAFWDALLDVTIAYGQRPLQALWWLGGLWLFATFVFLAAWRADDFKPNNPFVLRAPEWTRCAAPPTETVDLAGAGGAKSGLARVDNGVPQSQLDCFRERPEAASYPRFSAGIYAADVLFPLVEIEQQANWIPDPACDSHWDTGLALSRLWDGKIPRLDACTGWWAKGLVSLLIVTGWALSLLAVAGFSGLVKSD